MNNTMIKINNKTYIVDMYSPSLCKANPDLLFLFGDNTLGKGTRGQAIIRFEPNSIGIITKKYPTLEEKAFFSDSDYEKFVEYTKTRLLLIKHKINSGEYKGVVLPKDGLGTGLAKLPEKAPRLYLHLIESINNSFLIDYQEEINKRK